MILIPFSSGLDSTVLVHDALEKKEKIKVCYIDIKNNIGKGTIEVQQRRKILKLLEDKFNTYIYDSIGTEITVNSNHILSLPQAAVWIVGLLYNVTSEIKEVRIGYCKNDDAISFLEDIKKIWKSYQSICSFKLPKLTFPISKSGKIEHYYKLPSDIFQETFFCENPLSVEKKIKTDFFSWEDCGECGTCKRAKYDGTFDYYERNKKLVEPSLQFLSSGEGTPVKIKDSGLYQTKEKTTKTIKKTIKKK